MGRGRPGYRADIERRFWAKVDKNGPVPAHNPSLGPCWLWTATVAPNGYGKFQVEGKPLEVHRWAYERFVAPIPAGLTIDHLCRVHNCVNYERHLEPVTSFENYRRGEGKGAVLSRLGRCSKGHLFTPENTRQRTDVKSGGGRRCRICEAAYMREKRKREGRRWR